MSLCRDNYSKFDIYKIDDNELKSFIELLKNGFQSITKGDLTDMIINEANRLKQNEEWSDKYMDVMDRILQQGL